MASDGDVQLRGSEKICGHGSYVRKSLFRYLVLAYVSYGSRGKFKCELQMTPQKCDCGWSITPKIINGKLATMNEYPSVVAISHRKEPKRPFCAGSISNPS